MKKFAERFNEALAAKNIKQIDIVNKTGIAQGTISNYAQGKYEPKGLNLGKIADALDVNEAWLKGFDAPMEKKHSRTIIFPQTLHFAQSERTHDPRKNSLDCGSAFALKLDCFLGNTHIPKKDRLIVPAFFHVLADQGFYVSLFVSDPVQVF